MLCAKVARERRLVQQQLGDVAATAHGGVRLGEQGERVHDVVQRRRLGYADFCDLGESEVFVRPMFSTFRPDITLSTRPQLPPPDTSRTVQSAFQYAKRAEEAEKKRRLETEQRTKLANKKIQEFETKVNKTKVAVVRLSVRERYAMSSY
jgi:hypothetical protein